MPDQHMRGWLQSSFELLRDLWWKCATSVEWKLVYQSCSRSRAARTLTCLLNWNHCLIQMLNCSKAYLFQLSISFSRSRAVLQSDVCWCFCLIWLLVLIIGMLRDLSLHCSDLFYPLLSRQCYLLVRKEKQALYNSPVSFGSGYLCSILSAYP